MIYKDEIVDEVRRVREKHAAKFNYDIAAICADIRSKQLDGDRKVLSRATSNTTSRKRHKSPIIDRNAA